MIIDHKGHRHPTVTETGIYGFFDQYRWLSNFHIQDKPIVMWGIEFNCVECAYQAAKTSSRRLKKRFADFTPRQAKNYGSEVDLIPAWDLIKIPYMSNFVLQKYKDRTLRAHLINTSGRYLEETNNWGDMFWGVVAGKGQNNLGLISMVTREYYTRKEKFL